MMKLFKHKDTMPTEEYNKESNKLIEEISKIKKKKEELGGNCSTSKLATDRLTEIEQYINSLKLGQEFNDEVFTCFVEQIVVRNRYELEFHFKMGIKKTIKEKRTSP